MQKSSFINSILIATTIIALPIMGMELASDTPKTPTTINVELHLTKAKRLFTCHDKYDEHYCKVLGINWEENNNTHIVEYALFKNSGESDYTCWTDAIPKNLPQSTIPNSLYEHLSIKCPRIEYDMNYFPCTLPANFVEQLKKEKSIILKNSLFAEPVEIILHLKSMHNNSENKQLTLNTSEFINDVLKEFPSTPTEILQSSERATSTPKATSNFKTYIIPGIAVAGIIAWLIYLYQNNRLDFSQITNFMHSLTSKK